jgi:hypothetical protein
MEPTPTELEIWRQVSHTNDIGGTVELSEQLLPSSSKVVLRPRKLTHDLHRSQWKFGAVRAMLGGLAMRCYSPIWIVQDAKRRQAFVNRERFSAPFLFDNNSIRRPAHQFEPGRLHVSAPLAAALQRADELADGHRSALEDLTLSTESQVAVLAAIRIANLIPGRYRAGMRPINDGWPQHDMLSKIAGGSRLAPMASRLARLKRRRW